jgi:hypothetical protein
MREGTTYFFANGAAGAVEAVLRTNSYCTQKQWNTNSWFYYCPHFSVDHLKLLKLLQPR